jgi:hypothetical protein
MNEHMICQRFAEAIRGHWGIESMHWNFNVNIRDSECHPNERTLVRQHPQLATTMRDFDLKVTPEQEVGHTRKDANRGQ